MGFSDRPYSGGGGGGGFNGGGGDWAWKIWRALNYSFGIGTYFGIRVRVHIFFVIFVALELLRLQEPMWTLRWTAILFGSVLLHEFGHALACRRVGGQADDILLWPLGGLAFCAPPRRPWPEFVTVIWGPLVNVILCAIAYTALWVMLGADGMPVTFNPFERYLAPVYVLSPLEALLADIFVVNYILLLFNMLLVFYPFDGGRLVQIALWTRLGYGRSVMLATGVGMVGAVGIALWGLAAATFLLVLIGVFGFYTCYQQRKHIASVGPEFAAGGGDYYEATKPVKQGFIARTKSKRQLAKIERAAAADRALEAEVDRILEKVAKDGIHSLSKKEKKTLQDATEKQRGG